MSSFSEQFYDMLLRVRETSSTLFAPDVNMREDYGLARSWRHGTTTRATNAKVAEADIDWVNRWNTGGS
jgi:hypothetical protein